MKILLMNNSSVFTEVEVQATTIGELRTEKSFPAGTVFNVNGVTAGDDYQLREGDIVGAVSSNKTGG